MEIALLLLVLIPAFGAVVGSIIGRDNEKDRDIFNIAITGLELVAVTMMFPIVKESTIHLFFPNVMGTGMYLKLDMLRYIFVWFTAAVWFLTTLYSTQYLIRYENRNRYYMFYMLTLSATIGLFLSENLLNLFTFFEIMSFTSYILVIHDEDRFAHRAGVSYLSMAIAGGLIMLLGIFLIYDYTGTLNISAAGIWLTQLGPIKYVIAALMITGFGVKAAMFPLHVWLPKAHPAAPTPASAILSGILIKTGLFGIMITVHMILGADQIIGYVLMSLAMINMILGGVLALFQRNIKRILAYSSMSQAGFILFGIGLASLGGEIKELALMGTLMHMFNHAFFKVLLFMGAGIIYMILHELSINIIRGFGREKYILKMVFFIGMLGLSGIPGTNGYVSKTILHEALVEAAHEYPSIFFQVAELVFYAASAMTVAYMLKIFVTVFLEDNPEYQGQYKDQIRARALFPMAIISGYIIIVGIFPGPVLSMVEESLKSFNIAVHHVPNVFVWEAYKSSLITVSLGTAIYMMFVRRYLYRKMGRKRIYINPTTHWFQLEEHFYVPLLRHSYAVGFFVFQIIDRWVYNLADQTQLMMRRIGNADITRLFSYDFSRFIMEIPSEKTSSKIAEDVAHDAIDKVHDVVERAEDVKKEANKKVRDVVGLAHRRASSATYALYIVAALLLVSMIVVLLFSNLK